MSDKIDLEEMLVDHEGLRLKPYNDTEGHWSIGVGHNIDVDPVMRKRLPQLLKTGITHAEAMELLHRDIAKAQAMLDRCLPWWQGLSKNRQAALTDMTFNLNTRLLQFRVSLGHLSRGEYREAARAFMKSKWARQVKGRAITITHIIEHDKLGPG